MAGMALAGSGRGVEFDQLVKRMCMAVVSSSSLPRGGSAQPLAA